MKQYGLLSSEGMAVKHKTNSGNLRKVLNSRKSLLKVAIFLLL
jgi:hypothetical protein